MTYIITYRVGPSRAACFLLVGIDMLLQLFAKTRPGYIRVLPMRMSRISTLIFKTKYEITMGIFSLVWVEMRLSRSVIILARRPVITTVVVP